MAVPEQKVLPRYQMDRCARTAPCGGPSNRPIADIGARGRRAAVHNGDMRATTPDGHRYDVVILLPPRSDVSGDFAEWRKRHRVARAGKTSWIESLSWFEDNGSGAYLTLLAIVSIPVAFERLFTYVVIPILLFVWDCLLTVVMIPSKIITGVVLRRPWTVLVRQADNTTRTGLPARTEIEVDGLRLALRRRDAIAGALTSGASVITATSPVAV